MINNKTALLRVGHEPFFLIGVTMKKILTAICLFLSICISMCFVGCSRVDDVFQGILSSQKTSSICSHSWNLSDYEYPTCYHIERSVYHCSYCDKIRVEYGPTEHAWDMDGQGYPESCFLCDIDYLDWVEEVEKMYEDGLL